MRTHASLVTLFAVAGLAVATAAPAHADSRDGSGYKIFHLSNTTVPVQVDVGADKMVCSEVDWWGQSTLALLGVELERYVALNGGPLTALFDGGCEATRDALLAAAAGGPLAAELVVTLDEVVEWGVYEPGKTYCRRELRQFAYLQGAPLFPAYEYQGSATLTLSAPSYDDCLRLYAR